MKCNKCGYDDSGSGDMAHVCQRPSFRYGEHPTSFGLFNPKQEPVAFEEKFSLLLWDYQELERAFEKITGGKWIRKSNTPQRTWIGLTDDDLRQIILVAIGVAEAKLKEKNT